MPRRPASVDRNEPRRVTVGVTSRMGLKRTRTSQVRLDGGLKAAVGRRPCRREAAYPPPSPAAGHDRPGPVLSFRIEKPEFWRGRRDSNSRPQPWQGRLERFRLHQSLSAFPLRYDGVKSLVP
jgi:hypothetical protein